MDDHEVQAALQRHWAASDANDFAAEHAIYAEHAESGGERRGLLGRLFGGG